MRNPSSKTDLFKQADKVVTAFYQQNLEEHPQVLFLGAYKIFTSAVDGWLSEPISAETIEATLQALERRMKEWREILAASRA